MKLGRKYKRGQILYPLLFSFVIVFSAMRNRYFKIRLQYVILLSVLTVCKDFQCLAID